MKLYESTLYKEATWQAIEAAINDGTLNNDNLECFEQRLKELDEAQEAKAVSVGVVYKGVLAEINAYSEEKAKLEKRIKSLKNTSEFLKQYLNSCLDQGVKIKDPKVSISWRKSVSVQFTSDDVPDHYCAIKKEPSKSKVKEALEAGEKLPFAVLEEKQNIQIK